MPSGPCYKLADLVAACSDGTAVVLRTARDTAPVDFNLHTDAALRDFIAAGGLESPVHIRTAPWRNNRDLTLVILADSYAFYSGPRYGYVSFMFSPSTRKWLIKSFKLNTDPDPRAAVLSPSALAALVPRPLLPKPTK